MKDWIATDLDSTLFQRAWQSGDAIAATWSPADDGSRTPSSWMKADTHRLLTVLAGSFAMVPVTARDMDSFARVDVAGLPLRGPAVVANGAIILGWNGLPDEAWEARMTQRLAPFESRLHDFHAWLSRKSAGLARPRLVLGPGELPAYLVAKAAPGWWATPEARALLAEMDWQGCRVEVLGLELQVLPPGIGKCEATLEVQHRWFAGQAPLLCLGDMPLDLGFMRLGGLLATPAGSTLDLAWPV